MMALETDNGCKCPACLETERPPAGSELPYRSAPGPGRVVYHLALHLSLPLLGAILIGRSFWALVPALGFLAAYLANSLMLCPSCAYHHGGVRFCGCYPKSVLPYRVYLGKRWGLRENLAGRAAVLVLTVVPTITVLAALGRSAGAIAVLVLAIVVVFLTSVVSCPNCRQREVCYLGVLTIAGIRRKTI